MSEPTKTEHDVLLEDCEIAYALWKDTPRWRFLLKRDRFAIWMGCVGRLQSREAALAKQRFKHAHRQISDDECLHLEQPHTVWWMHEDIDPIPVPLEARFDNRADAIERARALSENPSVEWIKIFRSDNESYTCWRWG